MDERELIERAAPGGPGVVPSGHSVALKVIRKVDRHRERERELASAGAVASRSAPRPDPDLEDRLRAAAEAPELALDAPHAGTRRSALFWLAQRDDPEVAEFLADVIRGRRGG